LLYNLTLHKIKYITKLLCLSFFFFFFFLLILLLLLFFFFWHQQIVVFTISYFLRKSILSIQKKFDSYVVSLFWD
jgi:hypothetical protein